MISKWLDTSIMVSAVIDSSEAAFSVVTRFLLLMWTDKHMHVNKNALEIADFKSYHLRRFGY